MTLYSLDDLETRARQRADMENSEFVTSAELHALALQAAEELDDILLEAQAHNFRRKTFELLTVAGQVEYQLPTDFKRLVSVRLEWRGSNVRTALQAFQNTADRETLRRNWTSFQPPRYNLYYEPATEDPGPTAVAGRWMVEFDVGPISNEQKVIFEYIPRIAVVQTDVPT